VTDSFADAIRSRVGGPCASLTPHPDIDPGVYTTEEFESASPVTGKDALETLRLPGTPVDQPTGTPEWRYTSLPVSELLRVDSFVRALSELYGRYDSGLELYTALRRGEVSSELLNDLNASDAPTAAEELPVTSRDLVEPVADYERVESVIEGWVETDSYWPPAVSTGELVIDGNHRVAAFDSVCPVDKEVFVWSLQR